ncbi:SCP-like extracellular [Raphidiopsis curvata NIES-932]|nr:SCP-like extracellular [Raphidiopsis curvata NIES-932]
MFRQTAFGIGLTTLVLISGLVTDAISASNVTKKSSSAPSFNGSTRPVASHENNKLEKLVFEEINQYRTTQGLSKLILNSNISEQARIHSQNMANGIVKFSHHGFAQRVKSIHLQYSNAAENVAFNIGYNEPAKQAVIGWINSPGHLRNIRGRFELTGVGVAKNNKGEVYLTQIFINTPKNHKYSQKSPTTNFMIK